MIYLGGFFLLVATLILVVNAPKESYTLALVCSVYGSFGLFGFTARRFPRLGGVGPVYLAVFALMTPLVGLGTYLHYQDLTNHFLVLTLLNACAGLLYLVLAVQVRFLTYAYLGWSLVIAAAITIVFWLNPPSSWQWTVLALAMATLALLVPRRLRRFAPLALLSEPALHLASITAVLAVLGVQMLGWFGLLEQVGIPTPFVVEPAALALAACGLVLLIVGWRVTMLDWRLHYKAELLTLIDGCTTVFFAEAGIGVAIWAGLKPLELTSAVCGVALVEFGVALALFRWRPRRRGLRRFLEALALLLSAGSILPSLGITQALVVAFSTGGFVLVGMAIIEESSWLLLAALVFEVDYQQIGLAPTFLTGRVLLWGAVALGLWALALALRWKATTRRFAPSLYVIALGAAGYTTFLLLPFAQTGIMLLATALVSLILWLSTALNAQTRSPRWQMPAVNLISLGCLYAFLIGLLDSINPYQPASFSPIVATLALLLFAAATSIAGRLEQKRLPGGMLSGIFRLLAPLPLVVNDPRGEHAAMLALLCAVVALVVARLAPGPEARGLYGLALWTMLLAALHAQMPGVMLAGATTFLSLPVAAWLLAAFALLAAVGALWEVSPWAMVVPAALALWATFLLLDGQPPQTLAGALFIFALLAAGAIARQWRGRGWGAALQIAALMASPIEAIDLTSFLGTSTPQQVTFLLAFAAAAYLIALHEREPWLTTLAAVYAIVAALLLAPLDFFATLALTVIPALLGLLLRLPRFQRRIRRGWALAPYAIACICSLLTLTRGMYYEASLNGEAALFVRLWFPLILLGLAAIAYTAAAFERRPRWSALAALYAIIATLLLPGPDNHDLYLALLGVNLPTDQLLPTVGLVFATTAVGLLLGLPPLRRRVQRRAWVLAPYLTALVCSVLAVERALLSLSHHSSLVPALLLLSFAGLAYLVAVLERRPALTILAPIYALAGALCLPDQSLLFQFWLTVGLTCTAALAGLALRLSQFQRRVARAWAFAPYAIAFGSALLLVARGIAGGNPMLAFPLLACAVLAYLVGLLEQRPAVTVLATLYGLAAAWFLPALQQALDAFAPPTSTGDAFFFSFWILPGQSQATFTLALTFVFALIGIGLRLASLQARVSRAWAFAPYAAALGCSLLAVERGVQAAAGWISLPLLGLAVIAYLVAALEDDLRLTGLAVLYGLVAGFFLPGLVSSSNSPTAGFEVFSYAWFVAGGSQFVLTVVLAFALVAFGVGLRRVSGRVPPGWRLAPYSIAIGCSLLALERGLQTAPGLIFLVLLGFAVAAYLAALVEKAPGFMVGAIGYALLAAVFLPNQFSFGSVEGFGFVNNFAPGENQFWLTVGLTFGFIAAGMLLCLPPLRARVGRVWALAPYAAACGSSLLLLARGETVPTAQPFVWLTLLGVSLAAYAAAVVERDPRYTLASALYALLAGWLLPGPPDQRFWLTVVFTIAIAGMGLALRLPFIQPAVRRGWALAPYATALGCSLLTLDLGLTPDAQASQPGLVFFPLLGFAALAYLAAVLERAPLITALAASYAALAALLLPGEDTAFFFTMPLSRPVQAALSSFARTVGLAFATIGIGAILGLPPVRRRMRRAWVLAPYGIAALCSLLALERGLLAPGESLVVSLLLLGFAVASYLVAALERLPWITAVSLAYVLVGAALLPDANASYGFPAFMPLPGPYHIALTAALAFAFAGIGATLRRWPRRNQMRQVWALAPYTAAVGCSMLVLIRGLLAYKDTPWLALPLLGFALLSYLVAALERQPVLTILAVFYTLVSAMLLPVSDTSSFYRLLSAVPLFGSRQLEAILGIIFASVAAGAALRLPSVRLRVRPMWSWAPYASAVGSSLLALLAVPGADPVLLRTLLLVFAAVAYLVVVLEGNPWVGLVPACYALVGVLVKPDEEVLLFLALGLAALGLLTGRAAGVSWSWPFYAVASVAGILAAVVGQGDSKFEPGALLLLAVLSYLIAAIESRADLLPLALVMGALALASGAGAFHLEDQSFPGATLGAFLLLSWLYTLGQFAWEALPWLRPRGVLWWTPATAHEQLALWRSPRFVGAFLHRWAGLLLAGGTAFVALLEMGFLGREEPKMFLGLRLYTPGVLAAVAFFSLAGMLALLTRRHRFHIAWYLAGECLALACFCFLFGLGITSVQLLLLAPGTAQLVIGALLPGDWRLRNPVRLGQAASLVGALLLIAPALVQILQVGGHPGPDQLFVEVVSEVISVVEAILITFLGVVIGSRFLRFLGYTLVGVTSLIAIFLTYLATSLPFALGALALLLIGLATWLSIHLRGAGTLPKGNA